MLFAYLLLSLQSAPAAAATPVPPTPAPVPAVRKVCRQMPPETGSIMPGRRLCRTPAEWAAIDAANTRNVERFDEDRHNAPQRMN